MPLQQTVQVPEDEGFVSVSWQQFEIAMAASGRAPSPAERELLREGFYAGASALLRVVERLLEGARREDLIMHGIDVLRDEIEAHAGSGSPR